MSTSYRTRSQADTASPIWLLLLVGIIIAGLIAWYLFNAPPAYDRATDAEKKILDYAQDHDLRWQDWPKSIRQLLERNPETEAFVLGYPTSKNTPVQVSLEAYKGSTYVPLFLQWDPQWGYLTYGDDVAGITGCGPVCLSMVAFYLTGDEAFSPDKMIAFATENNYYVSGNGSSWTLISKGAVQLGFDVTELPLDKNRIRRNLEAGIPVICSMGPGDFTTSGHFIVLVGWEDGKIRINDPNSIKNSEKLWEYEDIEDQIRNLWAIRTSSE